ncbi:hypothetical protein ACHAXM_012059 [Skeletonema potamos]
MNGDDNSVIDWDEAMEQCGDDEDFLRELLSDLNGEIHTQMVKIEEALESVNEQSFLPIMRASHVIKGASSNLMCKQLRRTATNLEQAAAVANGNADAASSEKAVKECFEELKAAVDEYRKFLKSNSID